ncbi:MAG: AcrB/AcrD/AcrF family protein [Alphaproteobacteria bacterium]|jgi:multidrug efflux pump|nr:AcrB/AcrD/AcrF family protein [Alphaproteobacteria bacterium]
MNALIEASFRRSRTVFVALVLILVAGTIAYVTIPKESDPDVQIPVLYVSMTHDGISPEDAERLLVRPMETELRGLEGVKEMRSTAGEGRASVALEFEAGVDIDAALADVRAQVDIAKAELPQETDEPVVEEVNLALFPVLVVTLSGDLPERTLVRVAEELQDAVEGVPQVLDVEIAGKREELVEVVIDPQKIEAFDLRADAIIESVTRNNQLVAAGTLDTGQGRFAIKVPGLFDSLADIYAMPVKAVGDTVVTLADVATVRRGFKDPESFARVNGQPALALEVSKRLGTNILDTVAAVRAVVEAAEPEFPAGLEVGFIQDTSDNIRSMLHDLQNSVLSAVALVMIVVVAALGFRSALLVGFAVPGAFLTAILAIALAGLTVNMVVLFGLILAVGMLVDGAIVVTELADRRMAEGRPRRDAYREAAQRMAWPITAATATTLAAFFPLVFWPGIVGEFMRYLPLTLLATLTASLFMALVFVPNLGAMIGGTPRRHGGEPASVGDARADPMGRARGPTRLYLAGLDRALAHPLKVLVAALVVAVGVYAAYGAFGRGIEFFPEVEPERAQVLVHARGDLSIYERDALVRQVEDRILDVDGVRAFYTNTKVRFTGEDVDADTVGLILLEFEHWRERRPAQTIMAEIEDRTADLAGVEIEVREEEQGPPTGKPVSVEVAAVRPAVLAEVTEQVRARFEGLDGLVNISDSRPVPGIEWEIDVDRTQASRYGADVTTVGPLVQLVTNGVKVGTYRPDDADEEIDIRARYPETDRGLGRLDALRLPTERGAVPLANFVQREPVPKVSEIERVDGKRVFTVAADVAPGVLADDKVRELRAWLDAEVWPAGVSFTFKGEDEEQKAAQAFLGKAFGVAMFLIAMILVTQFNSFYQSALILSAVVFSTVGVLLGLLLTGQPFGIIMSGVGVIALAGIVVNNNIVLIDTYNELRRHGLEPRDAVRRTCAQRLRPVLLTTVTTVLGLMPMALRVNVDLFTRDITVGGPSMDWWSQLASAVAGGLAFATVLTLVVTPCLLYLPVHLRSRRRRAAAPPVAGTPLPEAAD